MTKNTQNRESGKESGKGNEVNIQVAKLPPLPDKLKEALFKTNGEAPDVATLLKEVGLIPEGTDTDSIDAFTFEGTKDDLIEKLTKLGEKFGLSPEKAKKHAKSAVKNAGEIQGSLSGSPITHQEEVSIEAPRLVWNSVRELYEYLKFKGLDLRMLESKGLWTHTFRFRGEEHGIAAVRDWASLNGKKVR